MILKYKTNLSVNSYRGKRNKEHWRYFQFHSWRPWRNFCMALKFPEMLHLFHIRSLLKNFKTVLKISRYKRYKYRYRKVGELKGVTIFLGIVMNSHLSAKSLWALGLWRNSNELFWCSTRWIYPSVPLQIPWSKAELKYKFVFSYSSAGK